MNSRTGKIDAAPKQGEEWLTPTAKVFVAMLVAITAILATASAVVSWIDGRMTSAADEKIAPVRDALLLHVEAERDSVKMVREEMREQRSDMKQVIKDLGDIKADVAVVKAAVK